MESEVVLAPVPLVLALHCIDEKQELSVLFLWLGYIK